MRNKRAGAASPQHYVLRLLSEYAPGDAAQALLRERYREFVQRHPDCLERSLSAGHLTASAWVTDTTLSKVLLVSHSKLGKWLQPGGHADGEANLLEVACREVQEETGTVPSPRGEEIFDLDIHEVPAHYDEPQHLHYDVRFHLCADANLPLVCSSESREVRWIAMDELKNYSCEESLLRMLRKSKSCFLTRECRSSELL